MAKNTKDNKLKQFSKLKTKAKILIFGVAFLVSLFMLSILYVVILQPIFDNFTLFLGIGTEDLTTGKYADADFDELNSKLFDTSCYDSSSGNWFASNWSELKDKLTPGINSNCELIELIKYKVIQAEKKYANYGLKLSPGLVTSTIVTTFGEQTAEDSSIDASEPINMLTAIVESNVLDEADIDSMIDAMIFKNKFWYYVCNATSCTVYDDSNSEVTATGKQCEKKLYYDAYFSQEKYEIFLRYGKEVADSYEAAYSHNESIKYTCDSCYKEFGGDVSDLVNVDLDKYLVKANTKTDTDDNISIKISQNEYDIFSEEISNVNNSLNSDLKDEYNVEVNKSYNYKDGFIYNAFPIYKSANYQRIELYIPKDIELDVTFVVDYAQNVNEMFELDTITTGSKNHQNISLKSEKADDTCPSTSCSCGNGNLSPTPGIPVSTGETANSAVCSYLPINATSDTMIRLRTCVGIETDIKKAMPGGTATLDEETGYYVADTPITLKRYIIGVAFAEIGAGAPTEALKAQMIASQTYLLHSLEKGGIQTNSNGELLVKVCSKQFQAYYDQKVVDSYDEDKSHRKQDYEDAYEAIKNQLVFDSRTGSTIFAEFGAKWSTARTVQANAGMTYTQMLDSSEVRNYCKDAGCNNKNWLYNVVKTCELDEGSVEAGTFVPDAGTTTNYSTNSTYTEKSQTLGIFGYLTYYQPDPNKRDIRYDGRWESANIVKVKKDCGNGLIISWKVHKLAKTTFEKAADGICQLTTTGIDGIIISPSDITFGGVFYPRKMTDALSSPYLSNHSFGTAMDINTNYNVTVNGTTYRDIYDRKLADYEEFIAAIGSESDPRNVNYILWKKVFQKLGFKWGGNWGRFGDDNKYDGMHFEIDWRQTK